MREAAVVRVVPELLAHAVRAGLLEVLVLADRAVPQEVQEPVVLREVLEAQAAVAPVDLLEVLVLVVRAGLLEVLVPVELLGRVARVVLVVKAA